MTLTLQYNPNPRVTPPLTPTLTLTLSRIPNQRRADLGQGQAPQGLKLDVVARRGAA